MKTFFPLLFLALVSQPSFATDEITGAVKLRCDTGEWALSVRISDDHLNIRLKTWNTGQSDPEVRQFTGLKTDNLDIYEYSIAWPNGMHQRTITLPSVFFESSPTTVTSNYEFDGRNYHCERL